MRYFMHRLGPGVDPHKEELVTISRWWKPDTLVGCFIDDIPDDVSADVVW